MRSSLSFCLFTSMSTILNSCRVFASSTGIRRVSSECFENVLHHSDRIRHVSPEAVHWFPGHMHKGMETIRSKMPLVDVIIEVHDARIPFSGRPDFFRKFEITRPTVLLLNKTDLAEPIGNKQAYKARIVEELHVVNRSPLEVHYTQLNAPEKQKRTLKRLLSSLPDLANSGGCPFSSTITVMVMGIPNSGKSTLINALRDIGHGGSGGAARVGRNAGQTRSVGQPIIICRGKSDNIGDNIDHRVTNPGDYTIQVFDSPGILEPRARTLSERLSLCVCGAVDLSSVHQELLVDYLLFWWNYRQRTEYISVFDLPGPTKDVKELLIHVCIKHDFFMPVANQTWKANEIESFDELSTNEILRKEKAPDIQRAASYVLKLFNNGYFGRATFLPEDEVAASKLFRLASKR
ncbi:unnamed protein product [Heterobilharzia americana]|nr:unnamed protein product [Heterobilharzia americana]CAH8434797.1 unnamed protein product [Heterobilharzia americana]